MSVCNVPHKYDKRPQTAYIEAKKQKRQINFMKDFVHLHVHTQYSLLDGQASVPKLVEKAIGNGMRGIAVTDHGSMFGIKEFMNYVGKKNSKTNDAIKKLKKEIARIEKEGTEEEKKNLDNLRKEQKDTESKIFKPIIGCEMYVARRGMKLKEGRLDQSGYHLVVLAKNLKGYKNLIKLVSRAWTDGYYMRPRTERSELEKFKEGLIISTACLGGEIPRKIVAGQIEEAEEAIRWYKGVFGDDFYLELQRHKATVEMANHEAYHRQVIVNEKLIELSNKYDVKIICTNDVHFVNESDAEAHDRLICLSTGKDINDPKRLLYTKQEWMKTKEEMNEIFADVPEALENTIEILDKVEMYSIDSKPIMPNFDIPKEFGTEEEYRQKFTEKDLFDEFTQDENGNVVATQEEAEKKIDQLGGYDKLYRIKLEGDYLAKLTFERAKEKYGEVLSDEVKDRLKFELHIMKTMGFPGYFLIVQDFINVARNELGVSVGPGRGSAAGSAVAYCLGITLVDPIKYDLLFERFLNPDRISLPDIDVDFDDDGRGEVLRWVTNKYGHEKVASIITYGTMATKSAIKDVARVQKLPLTESDRLTKLIPDKIPDKKVNLANSVDYVAELRAAAESENPILRDTIKYAMQLEGNVRNTGVHACGTIICRDDITDWVPISTADDKETGEKKIVTQYEGGVIEETGLIKMDFLGLKTLSIIKEALQNVKESRGISIDIDNIDLTDEKTYQLYSEGKTIGTFQFESAGMQKYLKELKPNTFEDLIAMASLYRPGPMEYIPTFIRRKHGLEPIEYDIPIMEKYLKDTYGVTVYQEQVMLLSRLLAGFTRGESDGLRKAMGKKLVDKLAELKPKFINGGKAKGYEEKVLEKIWGDWENFAKYAFNKSHSTCYSLLSFQTAYLKAHYPPEFMAAVMSRSLSNITEITKLMDECKAMGIQTLGPDVNESNLKFTVNSEGNIRFGLGAIKGVGEKAVYAIVDERKKNGPFKSIFDFVERVNLNACNKKNIECLAVAGAFDDFKNIEREEFFIQNSKEETFSEVLVRYGVKFQTDKQAIANSLFGGEDEIEIAKPEIPHQGEEGYNLMERLNREKELVGIYLSAHPLDEYSVVLDNMCNTTMAMFKEDVPMEGKEITMGGIIASVRSGITKAGNEYGIIKLEDYSGTEEIPFWGKNWVMHNQMLQQGNFIFIRASYVRRFKDSDKLELAVNKIELLSEMKSNSFASITISAKMSALDFDSASELVDIIKDNPGDTDIFFELHDDENKNRKSINLAATKNKVSINKKLISFIREREGMNFMLK